MSDLAVITLSGGGNTHSKLTIILVGVSITVALGTAVASFVVLLVLYTDISREYSKRHLKEPEYRNRSEGTLVVFSSTRKQMNGETYLDRLRVPQRSRATRKKLPLPSSPSQLKPTYRFKEAQEREQPPVVKPASSNQRRKSRTTSRSRRRNKHELNFMHIVTTIHTATSSSSPGDRVGANRILTSNVAKRSHKWYIVTKRIHRTVKRSTTEAATLPRTSSSVRRTRKWHIVTKRIPRGVQGTSMRTAEHKHSSHGLKPGSELDFKWNNSRETRKDTFLQISPESFFSQCTSARSPTFTKYNSKYHPRFKFYTSRIPKRKTRNPKVIYTTKKVGKTVSTGEIQPGWKFGSIAGREQGRQTLSSVLITTEGGKEGKIAVRRTTGWEDHHSAIPNISGVVRIPSTTLQATQSKSSQTTDMKDSSPLVVEGEKTRNTTTEPLTSEVYTTFRNTEESQVSYTVADHTDHDNAATEIETEAADTSNTRPALLTQDDNIRKLTADEDEGYVEIRLKAGRRHSKPDTTQRIGDFLSHCTAELRTSLLTPQQGRLSHRPYSKVTKRSQTEGISIARSTRSTDKMRTTAPDTASKLGYTQLTPSPSKKIVTVTLVYRKPKRIYLFPDGPRVTIAPRLKTQTVTIEVRKATHYHLPLVDTSNNFGTNSGIERKYLSTTPKEPKHLPNPPSRRTYPKPMYKTRGTTPKHTTRKDISNGQARRSPRKATTRGATAVPERLNTYLAISTNVVAITKKKSVRTGNNTGTEKTVPTEPFADYDEPLNQRNLQGVQNRLPLGHSENENFKRNDHVHGDVSEDHIHQPSHATLLGWPATPTHPVFVQRDRMHEDSIITHQQVTNLQSSPRTRSPYHSHKQSGTKEVYSSPRRHTHHYFLTTLATEQAVQDQFRTTPDTTDSFHNSGNRLWSTVPRSTWNALGIDIYDVVDDNGITERPAKIAHETTDSHMSDNIDVNSGITHADEMNIDYNH